MSCTLASRYRPRDVVLLRSSRQDMRLKLITLGHAARLVHLHSQIIACWSITRLSMLVDPMRNNSVGQRYELAQNVTTSGSGTSSKDR
jgi:hypothetical protein